MICTLIHKSSLVRAKEDMFSTITQPSWPVALLQK